MIGTPRANGVNGSAAKRRPNFNTPASKAHKSHEMSSPAGGINVRGDGASGTYVNTLISLEMSLQS